MSLSDTITKWVVNDYFTPNIKAEVILDTLLTPVIHRLVPGTELVAKEMSIPEWKGSEEKTLYGVHGPKIDYVLAGPEHEKVFLVELKTTLSSLDDKQAESYLKNCGQSATFGKTLGRQLLSLLQKGSPSGFGLTRSFQKINGGNWNDNSFAEAFKIIQEKVDPYKSLQGNSSRKADQAKNLIRARGWAQSLDMSQDGIKKESKEYRSRKYLFTLGQLVDYLEKGGGNALWEKPLQIIYLTPGGQCPQSSFQKVDLDAFVSGLEDTPYTRMLKEVMRGIYGEDMQCLN